MGVQIFIATHDYTILKELDLRRKQEDELVFHSLYRDDNGEIARQTAHTYLDIHPNTIAESVHRPVRPRGRAQSGGQVNNDHAARRQSPNHFPPGCEGQKIRRSDISWFVLYESSAISSSRRPDRVLFIELKDPEHPCAKEERREKFIEKFHSGPWMKI